MTTITPESLLALCRTAVRTGVADTEQERLAQALDLSWHGFCWRRQQNAIEQARRGA
jgi:hypothetical protein